MRRTHIMLLIDTAHRYRAVRLRSVYLCSPLSLPIGKYQTGSQRLQQMATFQRQGFRHSKDLFIPFNSRYHSQTHSCISTGRLNQGSSRKPHSFSFRVFHPAGQRHPVFHTSRRMERFRFCYQPASRSVLFFIRC